MKWLIEAAEAMDQNILKDCLENYLPKCRGTVFPDRTALKYLAKVYNTHLNPTKVPLDMGCSECRGELMRYWGIIQRVWEEKSLKNYPT